MNAVLAMRQLLLVMNTTHTDATGHRRRYLRGPPGQRSIVKVLVKAGDKANATAPKITRCPRRASALFRRSTAFRDEILRSRHEVLDVALGEEMMMTVPNDTR